MAQKPYTGFRGKSFWDISNFSKGVRYTNESLKEGTLAMLTNLNITGSGASLVPRHPYINSLFKIDRVYGEEASPTPLGKQTYLYTPIQKSGAEYFITLNHLRPENTVVEYNLTDVSYEVIDGDTIKIDGEVFRLLGIDAPEIDTREGQLSKAFLENLIYEWEHNIPPGVGEQPILEVIFDKFNPNSVDTYGRKLVWLSLPVTDSEFLNWIPPYDGDAVSYFEDPTSWVNSPPDGSRITSEFSAHSWVNGQALVKSNYRTFPENIGDMMVKVADSTSPGKFFYYQSRLRTESLTQLANKELFENGHAQPMGYYNKEEGTKLSLPKYSYTDMSKWHRANWNWDDEVDFIEVKQYPAIFKKDAKTVLKPYQHGEGHTKIPYIDLAEENFLNTSGVAEDMGLSAGHPLTIEFVSEYIEKEHEKYNINTEIRSLTTMPYFDGFMFIGKVLDGEKVLYKGPMSVNYEVPLTEDSLEVDWDNAFFRIRSYKNDIYKLNYADLETTSPNLLQGGTISTASLFGKEAEDEGENFPRIKAILLRDSKENPTKVFSEIRGDKEYYIHPMVVIPPMNEINGLGGEGLNYDGYAYRWVVTSLTGATLSSTSPQEELRWKATETKTSVQGTVGVLEEGLSCSIEGDLQATSVGVFRIITKGIASNETNFNNAHSSETAVKLVGESLEDLEQNTEVVVVSQIPEPVANRNELYLGRTANGNDTLTNDPYRMGSLSDYLTKFGAVISTYDSGDNLDNLANEYFSGNPSTKIYGLSWGNYVEYYLPRKKVEYKKVDKEEKTEYNQFICVPEPVVSYTDWIQGFDTFGEPLTDGTDGLRDWIVSTKDPRFAKSPRGIRIELQIAPYTKDENGKISQSRQTLEDSAYTFTSIAYVYGSDEVEIPLEQDNTAIYESKYITNFDDRAVLYGSPKFNNVMYLSGILGFKGITSPLSYFPLNYALDQFDAPIVHVQPYRDRLIVFTTLDIWQVNNELIEVEEGAFVDSYKAKKILQNISVEKYNKNTIRVVGNILVFLSNNVLYALRPNLYSDLEDNLQLIVLSDSIRGLLSDPVDFLFKRLRHRNMLFLQPGDVKPTVDTFLSIHNNIIKLFLSMYIGEFKLPYMIECEYDMENARWTVHDNIACSFPIQAGVNDAAEGPFYLMKNHPTIDNGLTYMKREGVNSWIFAEDYGKRFDIKAVKVTDTGEGSAFVFNSTDSKDYEDIKKIKQPINCLIDTGNIDSSNHLYKRVSQVHMELSNIDATTVPINIDFYIDGHIRQTSNTLAIQESTTGYLEMVEKTILNEYNVSNVTIHTVLNDEVIPGDIQFSNWILDTSLFSPSHRLLARFGVSGRGRVPRADIIFELADKIEIYRIAFVYKEQSGR